jgi:hypothetical protein
MAGSLKNTSVDGMMEDSTNVVRVQKSILTAMNQLYELERKIKKYGDPGDCIRNIDRMKDAFGEFGLTYEDPMGQAFKETRTDLEASISGAAIEDLIVVEVIKPIIRIRLCDGTRESSRIVQKGIVVVASQKEH